MAQNCSQFRIEVFFFSTLNEILLLLLNKSEITQIAHLVYNFKSTMIMLYI